MADAIVRLRVESSEYDQKLSRATQQLQHMEKEVRRTGATFAYADKEELEFIKSLGSMETKATSAKGKINEMNSAFTEWSLLYKRMSKEEKASPFGKGLAQSLEQLKGRIKDSKAELSTVEGSLNGFGDVAKNMAGKLGLPVEQLAKFGPYGAAAAVAIKVAGDAFKQNELIMDEFGRETEEAKGIYQGFLNALNTGDFSSFFSNLDKIRSSARAAYDALDELGTFNAFNQIQTEKARTNFTEATANYREGTGSKEDVKAAGEALKKEMQTRQQKEQDAYIAAIKQLAATRGVDEDMLRRVLEGEYGDYDQIKKLQQTAQASGSGRGRGRGRGGQQSEGAQKIAALSEMLNKLSDEELQRIQGLGVQAQRTATEIAGIDKQMVRILGGKEGGDAKTVKVPVEPVLPEGSIAALRKQLQEANKAFEMASDDEGRGSAKKRIEELTKQLEILTGKAKTAAQAVQMVEGTSGYSANALSARRGDIIKSLAGQEIGSAGYMADAKNLVDLDTFTNLLKVAAKNGLTLDEGEVEGLLDTIDAKLDVSDSTWQEFVDKINEQLKELNLDPIKLDVKTGGVETLNKEVKQTTDHVAGAAQAFEALGNAMGQIEDPGAKVAGLIANAIASIASGYGQAVAQAGNGSAGGPWGWIAFAISGLATMISTIAAVKSATAGSYASGGIIEGNSYSGDNMRGILPNGDLIGLNSGEVVLNAAQQSNLAGQLQSNPMGNLRLSTDISGSNLRVVLNNDNRQRGGSRNVYGVH